MKAVDELINNFFTIYENPADRCSYENGFYDEESMFIEVTDINFSQFGNFESDVIEIVKKKLLSISPKWIRKSDLE